MSVYHLKVLWDCCLHGTDTAELFTVSFSASFLCCRHHVMSVGGLLAPSVLLVEYLKCFRPYCVCLSSWYLMGFCVLRDGYKGFRY